VPRRGVGVARRALGRAVALAPRRPASAATRRIGGAARRGQRDRARRGPQQWPAAAGGRSRRNLAERGTGWSGTGPGQLRRRSRPRPRRLLARLTVRTASPLPGNQPECAPGAGPYAHVPGLALVD